MATGPLALVDEESKFLREVNEIMRTSYLKNKKIDAVLKYLQHMDCREPMSKLESRIQTLVGMTLSQQTSEKEEAESAPTASDEWLAKRLKDFDAKAGENMISAPDDKVVELRSQLCAEREGLLLRLQDEKVKMDEVSYQTTAKELQQVLDECESAIRASVGAATLLKNLQAAKTAAEEEHGDACAEPDAEPDSAVVHDIELARKEADANFKLLSKALHTVDIRFDETLEAKLNAFDDLEKFELNILQQWKEKRLPFELCCKGFKALSGARVALRVAVDRCDWLNNPDAAELDGGDGAATDEAARSVLGDLLADDLDDDSCDLFPRLVSDYLHDGHNDPREREDVLKRNHAGSQLHPHGCRPCHFQGGQCWKGLACSFCHICPKPKRKSKHQRDVDKRRQERYRQVKDSLGVECLDELTKIDDSRRHIMTSSEELKKLVKDAYDRGEPTKISEVRRIVTVMQSKTDDCRAEVPPTLLDDDGEFDDMSVSGMSAVRDTGQASAKLSGAAGDAIQQNDPADDTDGSWEDADSVVTAASHSLGTDNRTDGQGGKSNARGATGSASSQKHRLRGGGGKPSAAIGHSALMPGYGMGFGMQGMDRMSRARYHQQLVQNQWAVGGNYTGGNYTGGNWMSHNGQQAQGCGMPAQMHSWDPAYGWMPPSYEESAAYEQQDGYGPQQLQ